jgi:hypothetical protein
MADGATFHAIAPQFVVPDVVRTAEWYRDNLGFQILGYFLDPPVYSIVSRGGVYIHFGKGDTDQIHTNQSIRKGSMEAWVDVTNIQALYDEFAGRGLDVPYPPCERVYGRTEIEITDRDGHKLVFGE